MASISDRLAAMFRQQTGNDPNANLGAYGGWTGTELPQIIRDDQSAYDASKRKWGVADKLAMGAAAIPFAAAAPAVFGAAGAAGSGTGAAVAGPATAGATAGPVAATTSRLASIFGSPLLQTGINGALALFGQKAQGKANDQARADTLAYQTKQIEIEQQRLAQEAQNANLDREDAKALNAAIQELEKKKYALTLEQAQFDRSKYETEQAQLEPYRKISAAAQQRLASMWGL